MTVSGVSTAVRPVTPVAGPHSHPRLNEETYQIGEFRPGSNQHTTTTPIALELPTGGHLATFVHAMLIDFERWLPVAYSTFRHT